MKPCATIGVKGLCNEQFDYYLEPYGISLQNASKIADSSKITGQQLVSDMVSEAWQSFYNDVRIGGYKANKISKSFVSIFLDSFFQQVGASLDVPTCIYETFYLKRLEIKVVGTLLVTLTINGVSNIATYTDETILLENEEYDEFSLSISTSGTGQLQLADNGLPFVLNGYVKCDVSKFICQYTDLIINAVRIKASALILNNAYFSDRYNDFILYKKEDIARRVAQLDSSLSILETEKKGLYQLELENINNELKGALKDNKCNCCFECYEVYSTKISIP